ncbi:cytochrome bd-I oxidase subunit CydX [Phyllobacterium phragmitis]|uniref:Cytochrome bd-I oxidase subunit CydX n=1 Tax=Phyllobacterium phragmitis TaxID=2670329 RepID=A0ABQ0GWX9_9HYPH
MWYFSWLLGLPLAVAFAVLNAMWYELMDDQARHKSGDHPSPKGGNLPGTAVKVKVKSR